ncbi:phosphomethylpyrimidine synthase ThiC [Succinispira mobilis]|uniref:phosphomethylpyrimidine synthase ThiC n=1 Tax=Succinispira mobilis TaxID=78120 RepID=UPI00036F7E08|nr:phosphomethylpyrimidine synthase ThiC [Succinispira mobilis]
MTQLQAAKKGIITKELSYVAEQEGIKVENLLSLVAKGKVVIPANINHSNLRASGIGEGLKTKVNVNLGISNDCADWDLELEKAKVAITMQANAIMDLSCYGKTQVFRKKLLEISPVPIGTVPMYDAIGLLDKDLQDITTDEFFQVVETHAQDGVDFMTIHCGINKATAQKVKDNKRLTNIVSRGGSILFAWMELNDRENPFFAEYDRLLDICAKYDVTLSLGDACRPGSIADSTDAAQIEELIVLGELTKRAWEKGVQVMIEGPGHMALNEVAPNMLIAKKLCHGAPLYVLGPIVTDVAPGYDHITSAIGGAIAASSGADFLCFVTPAEHLRLPDLQDMKDGIVAARIAAHAGDIAKNLPNARNWDNEMSKARADVDFEKMIQLAMDPEKAKRYRESSLPGHKDTCTMCGKMCPMRNMKKVLGGEKLNLHK